MGITLSTVVNLLLFSGIAILLLEYVVSKCEVLLRIGVKIVLYVMMVLVIRLLFPFELPNHINIKVTKIWPDIYLFLIEPRVYLFDREWSIINILMFVSIAGSFFFLIRLFVSYYMIIASAKNLKPIDDIVISENIYQINASYKKTKKFKIVEGINVKSPIIFGLFKPYIVLPQFSKLDINWYYILYHEISHFYFRDLWLRFICEILQVLYWWNPLIYLLRNQITKIQELRVDSLVIGKLSEMQKYEYLECLVKIAKLKEGCFKKHFIARFSNDCADEVIKRISAIFQVMETPKRKRVNSIKSLVIGFMLVMCIFVIPNLFIVEPHGLAVEHSKDTYNDEEIYLIKKSDGTYDVYGKNEYIGTLTELPDANIKIINEGGRSIE